MSRPQTLYVSIKLRKLDLRHTTSNTASPRYGIVRVNRLEPPSELSSPLGMQNPFRYFNSSPEIIRLAVMMYIRYPLSLRQVEDILFERGIDICHETVRYWWNRFSLFEQFGGVPEELLFDQMRAVVLSDDRAAAGGLVLNAEFLRFAAHWGFMPRSCRPYRAQTKGKVERPIRYIRESFFYGRTFANDDDLNEQASLWLEGTANLRRHATTGERPVDRFERDERSALLPLANCPYRRLGLSQAPEPTPRRLPATVEVERRPLTVYAEALQ